MVCAIALLVIGVVMVSSAKMAVQPLEPGADPVAAAATSGVTPKSIILSRSTAYMCLAVLAMFAASWLPVTRLAPLSTKLCETPKRRLTVLGIGTLVLVAVLASVYIPGIGREVNGSSRWVNLRLPGLESVQPSEIAKWALIPLIAWYAGACAASGGLRRFFVGLAPGLIAVGAISGFVVMEDLGTGFLMGVVGCLLLVAGGARLWHFLMFVPIGLAGVVYAIVESPYRLRRITSFLDPFADPQGDGYHMIQSMSTVAGAGPFGRGLGHGLQKFGYLPEDTTDFLFAVICEELGLAGATLVITLMGALLWTLLGIVRRAELPVLKLIGLGVAATFGLQACINLVVVTGMGPTKGIALPLISSGGTGWILTSAMLGLVVAIDRRAAARVEEIDEPAEIEDDAPLEGEIATDEDERSEPPEIVVPRRVKPRVRITPVPSNIAS